MSRRKKPRSPPLTNKAPTAHATNIFPWQACRVQVDGQWCEGFELGGGQTGTRVLLVEQTLLFRQWWYHPGYDEAPHTREFRIGVREFLQGQSQREVLLDVGAEAFEHLLSWCQGLYPDTAGVNIRATVMPPDRPQSAWARRIENGLAWCHDRWGTALDSCYACWGLVLVIVLGTSVWLSPSVTWWWHGRVLKDLHPHAAQVVTHEVLAAQRSVGGGHKKAPTGVTYVFTPHLSFQLQTSPIVLTQARQGWPTLDTRHEAQQWMATHHPLNQSTTLWTLPEATLSTDTLFVLSPEDSPNHWTLLGEAIVKLLLVGLIYLPLLVLALLLAGIALSGAISWLTRRM